MKKQMLCLLAGILWMNFALSQPIITVWGREDSLAVKEQIARYLHHLDVREKVYLSVYFSERMPEELKGAAFCLNSPEPGAYRIIRVRIDVRLSKRQQELVLAHEMIHVKQYAKEELVVVNRQKVLWKGRTYRYQRAADLRLSPWEHEAHRKTDLLAKRGREQPEVPLTALQTRP